jgi:hypothetical protein
MVQNLKYLLITCIRLQVLSIQSTEIEVTLTQQDILKIKYTENCLKMSGILEHGVCPLLLLPNFDSDLIQLNSQLLLGVNDNSLKLNSC